MSENTDSDLRRYFAETGELSSDDEFVRRVTRRIHRDRRRRTAMTAFAFIAGLAAMVRVAPLSAAAAIYVGDLPTRLAASVVASVLSPAGLVLPIVIAVLLLSLPPESQYW